MIKVGGKQKPYEMWQAGNSLAASPLANFLAGFAREDGGSAARSPAHESRQLRRLADKQYILYTVIHFKILECIFQAHLLLNKLFYKLLIKSAIDRYLGTSLGTCKGYLAK